MLSSFKLPDAMAKAARRFAALYAVLFAPAFVDLNVPKEVKRRSLALPLGFGFVCRSN